MTNFASKIAGVATLALTARVQVSDLNLASIDGVATLHQRVGAAAQQICGEEKSIGQKAACKAGVRTEVQEKLTQRQIMLASAI